MKTVLLTENNAVDGAVLVELARLGAGLELEAVNDFNGGWRAIVNAARNLLESAQYSHVGRAIIAIDNDGGSVRRPVHTTSHDRQKEAQIPEDGCATCLLLERCVPAGWDNRAIIVVPVQTIETWLLTARGYEFKSKTPEQTYARRVLKKSFYGDLMHANDAARRRAALEALSTSGALERLAARPSCASFLSQLAAWKEG